MEFIITQPDDVLVSYAGLALAAALLQRTDLWQRLDAMKVEALKRLVMPHGEVLLSMIGLLCLGKGNYAANEPFRRESFFARSLGLSQLPSAKTPRQRMDQLGMVPLDVDVLRWDSSGTKKQGVACTYMPCDQVALAEDRQLPPRQKMSLNKPVTRRRLRSMMQDLTYLAAPLIHHARRFGLEPRRGNSWRFV